MPDEAGPVIVRLLSVIFGNVLVNLIVPVTLKLIVLLPVPAAQPFTVVLVLAAVIAARRVQLTTVPLSASELTVIIAACAAVLSISANAMVIPTARALRIPKSPRFR